MKDLPPSYDQIYCFKHLSNAAYRAKKGNQQTQEVQQFYFNLEKELIKLSLKLQTYTYQPGPYRYFNITDPKPRKISVAPFRDRVVHHALVSLLEEKYNKRFIYDSYACQIGKGTHRAVYRAQYFLRKNKWFFKSDVASFFDMIDHEILFLCLRRVPFDPRLISLAEIIVENGGKNGKGLPIGNLTSQFFANVYLHELDFFVKQQLGCKYYIRYMDDFVLFSNDKAQLKEWRKQIEQFLAVFLKLILNPKATFFNQRMNGLRFLGTRVFPKTIRIHPDNLKRSFRKIKLREKQYLSGDLDEDKLLQCVDSIQGHMCAYNTTALRKQRSKGCNG